MYVFVAYTINKAKFHKANYWYMMKQPKSNLHVLSSCEQQRLLSPCRSATFVKEIARETIVFKLLLNWVTTALAMGISEEKIQKMGRWHSKAFQNYIGILT
jgi:hypothetical protein